MKCEKLSKKKKSQAKDKAKGMIANSQLGPHRQCERETRSFK